MKLVFEPFSLAFIGRVANLFKSSPPPIHFVGVHSCVPLALVLSEPTQPRLVERPRLIVTPDLESAEALAESLLFFDPQLKARILPPFDVGVYTNLYPNHRVITDRLRWLFNASHARPGEIFIAPIEGLLQKTMPFAEFSKSTFVLRRGSNLPDDLVDRLQRIGYVASSTVEDVGTYSIRGGIIDIYSPANAQPYRIELLGDTIESIRLFDPSTQISTGSANSVEVLPAREVLYSDENRQLVAKSISAAAEGRNVSREELQDILRSVSKAQPFYGIDFLLPYFYSKLDSPIDYFTSPIDVWVYDPLEIARISDALFDQLKSSHAEAKGQTLRIDYKSLYLTHEEWQASLPKDAAIAHVNRVHILDAATNDDRVCDLKSSHLNEFTAGLQANLHDPATTSTYIKARLSRWRAQGYRIFIAAHSLSSIERIKVLLEKADFQCFIAEESNYQWSQLLEQQQGNINSLTILLRPLSESFRLADDLAVFLREEDLLGKRRAHRAVAAGADILEHAEALSFGELQPGDFVVHRIHGVGIYEGLKPMKIEGADAEFIELKYKDGDRLYLPVYRVAQLYKYSGPNTLSMIDKLGGSGWAKTKTKVRNQLRDVASKLLELYAKRSQATRPAFSPPDDDYFRFENTFKYQETDDQLRAIETVLTDLQSEKPMDRLICGDVGFGKTEVALRATFKTVQEGKQVAIIAPTTILTHQHYENFKRRFANWPIVVRALNRFVSAADVKKTLQELKSGGVDVVIGTHRLLSKDVGFKNLGLLVVDEEQKFGVTHKERLRHLRESVDTLAMSATPIPRTLNMSLVGIRDLSLINTPPQDRLPTRTYVCKRDPDTIRKAIESEISRGGQVFFLHNRVQSIEEASAFVRDMVPSARIAIAHGQMDEAQLESTMMKFYNHELDVLVCTAIIESGMDIPRANTIFIDSAQTFGVSQLYQLRGRVGRSKERAYCYLVLPQDRRVDPVALERLKVIQENTALGSGLRVAQYDLELRGAGDILGEDQSGHINAVGYELYLELLEEAVGNLRGDTQTDKELEPEINLRISALLPDKYIPDIRMRLYYYKTLSSIRSSEDADRIEQELRDQFGPPPEPVMNLFGLMLIRKLCRDLGVRDISAGKNIVTLAFTEKTRLPPNEVVRLTTRENKKFQLTPDQRLKIRMNEVTWPRVVDELESLLKL
jgi:transcription-repair coupling factor (superfamily II helicase)